MPIKKGQSASSPGNGPCLARHFALSPGAMIRPAPAALLACLALALPGTARARDVLGVFQNWGAFRDGDQGRCFAIAQPLAGGWRPSPMRQAAITSTR